LEELAAACGLSRAHAYRLAAQLEAMGIAEREGGVVRVADPELLQLLKRVGSKFSVAELLSPKALELLESAADRLALEAAARTGLSRSGLSSRLTKLRGIGAGRIRNPRALAAAFAELFSSIETVKLEGRAIAEVLELALAEGVAFYDAAYLHAARKLGMKLVTEDSNLKRFPEAVSVSELIAKLERSEPKS